MWYFPEWLIVCTCFVRYLSLDSKWVRTILSSLLLLLLLLGPLLLTLNNIEIKHTSTLLLQSFSMANRQWTMHTVHTRSPISSGTNDTESVRVCVFNEFTFWEILLRAKAAQNGQSAVVVVVLLPITRQPIMSWFGSNLLCCSIRFFIGSCQ